MNGWTLTRVWDIDGRLVVAKTTVEAIELMKTYYKDDKFYEPKNIRCLASYKAVRLESDYDAIIKEE